METYVVRPLKEHLMDELAFFTHLKYKTNDLVALRRQKENHVANQPWLLTGFHLNIEILKNKVSTETELSNKIP